MSFVNFANLGIDWWDVCFNNNSSNMCLEEAIRNGDVYKAKQVLSNKNFDPNQPNEAGLTYLEQTIIEEQYEIFELLLNHPNFDPNLSIGTSPEQLEFVKDLFKHPNIDVYLKGESPVAPLQDAMNIDQEGIARDLLAHMNIEEGNKWSTERTTECLTERFFEFLRFSPVSWQLEGNRCYTKVDPILFLTVFIGMQHMMLDVHNGESLCGDSELSGKTSWTYVCKLPVSNDETHRPPKEFTEELEQVYPLIRSKKHGEIEVIHIDEEFHRVVYRTDKFVTVSLLKNAYPIGVTIYKPLLSEINPISKKKPKPNKVLLNCPHIWHIANNAVTKERGDLLEILKRLGENNFCVFRSLNADHDPELLVKGLPLAGRGTSTKVRQQVDSGNTGLVSVSTIPMSKFLADKRVKNGGYSLILTERGASLFLGFDGKSYPAFISHEKVLEEMGSESRLVTRVREASEAMFRQPINAELIVLLDDGYPTPSGGKNKKDRSETHLAKDVANMLQEMGVSFQNLSAEHKKVMASDKRLKNKRRLIEEHYCSSLANSSK